MKFVGIAVLCLLCLGCSKNKIVIEPRASDYCLVEKKILDRTGFDYRIKSKEHWDKVNEDKQFGNWFVTKKKSYKEIC